MMKKLSGRLLGAFLAVMMVVTMTPNSAYKASAAAAAQSNYATGDIIEYGSYPQTKVTDADLITALNAQTLSAENTADYAGAKYQREYFTTANNAYQALNGYAINTVYWFKFEPIQWRVLSSTAGELFVMAEKILDSNEYNQVAVNTTWETSSIRFWLNSGFYNTAFSSAEKAAINSTTVVNEDYLTGTDGGNNTSDKLFLLSYNEAITSAYGFSSDYNTTDTARRAQGTDYSKSIGLYSSSESLYAGNSLWWLRTPGENQTHFCILTTNGVIDTRNYNIDHTGFGARPAFKINQSALSTITFDSAGGSAVKSITGLAGSAVIAPAEPTKAGLTFLGWDPALPAVFPVGGLAVTAQWGSKTYSTGDIIEYGSYPQTKVTNLDLINTLEAQTLSAENTVVYAGAKYQREYFTTANNAYQALNGYAINTVYWFKFEPIQWRVLSSTAGELFVMAEKILDSNAFNQVAVNTTWETSSIRFWLNSGFYNTAFSSAEKAAINSTTVVNEDYLTGTDGGNNTSDKLFLLSYNEAITSAYGFSSDYNTTDTARRAQGTDYSKSIGLYSSSESLYAGNSLWWLRTPGENQTHFCILTTNGVIDTRNYNIDHTGFGARPAFKINQSYLTTITFDSAGGSPLANLVGNIGAPVVAPADPTKAGFTFNGWNPTLPATFPVGGLAVTAQWAPKIYVTGDKIEYGSYPQSKITNTNLIAMLDAQTLSADNTVVYDGVKYQREYFTQYTPFLKTSEPNATNSYQDDNGYYINTAYWFKFEPITWRVLSNTDDELLVMADKVLDSKAYNEDNTSVTWETSSIRSWLNNNFYNTAFSSTERALITSTLVNQDNSQHGTLGGNNTSDNVFLLSYADSLNTAYGFSSSNQTQDIARQANGTDFSKSNGLKVVTSGTSLGDVYWWLRTPGFFQYNACIVGIDGRPSISGSRVDYGYDGARPACIISLTPTSTIAFDSAGGTAVATVTGGIGKTVHSVSAPSKAGFTFNGWDPALPATFPDGGFSTTAQWKANNYNAYFYVDGELRATEITAYGASIDAPYFYTKEGYTFAGWDPAVPATMPAHELTFNALWTINQSTITFDSAGGTAVAPLTGDFGAVVPSVADPTKAGFIFNGWNPSLPVTFPDGGLAVTAQWIMLGDVNSNGFITVTDALLTLQDASSLITLTFTQKIAADVYKDNNISVSDALKMLQFASGLITSF